MTRTDAGPRPSRWTTRPSSGLGSGELKHHGTLVAGGVTGRGVGRDAVADPAPRGRADLLQPVLLGRTIIATSTHGAALMVRISGTSSTPVPASRALVSGIGAAISALAP